MNSANLLHYLKRFSDLRIVVIGDAMLDHYLRGPSDRLCREAPVPIVDVTSTTATGGGAANTAINARSLGSRVEFVSVAGDDGAGRYLRRLLNRQGIGSGHLVLDPGRRTLSKHRILANDQLLARFDQGTTTGLSSKLEAKVMRSLEHLFTQADAIIRLRVRHSDAGC